MKTKAIIPDYTPWGHPQTTKVIGQGMVLYSTAGHGGIWLSDDRLLCLPKVLADAPTFTHAQNWFEEDIDAILPVLAFPAEWSDQACWNAVNMATNYRNSPNGTLYPLVKACKMFLELPISEPVRNKAQLFAETNRIAEKWERGSCSSAKTGWFVHFTRGTQEREELMRRYPTQQFWTDEEIKAGMVTIPPMPPLPPGVASCADLPPRLTDAGEVSWQDQD